MLRRSGFVSMLTWITASVLPAQAQQAGSDIAMSTAWILIGVSALLIAVGALLVFTKLARYLDELSGRTREKK